MYNENLKFYTCETIRNKSKLIQLLLLTDVDKEKEDINGVTNTNIDANGPMVKGSMK